MDNQVKLWGYTVYRNGDIISKNGNKITKANIIKIYNPMKNKYTNLSYARVVYYAFHQKDFNYENKQLVIFLKNKNDGYNIDNLVCINRKETLYREKHFHSKLTDKQVEEIKAIYNAYKSKSMDKNNPFTKISFRKLGKKYHVSHTLIRGIVNGLVRNDGNYVIK